MFLLDFDSLWIDFECTKCGYTIDVQLVDVKSEKTVYRHNCEIQIQLVDDEASTHFGIDNMQNALNKLEENFKNFKR